MPVNEYAICDVGGYQTCAGVGGRSGSGPADCRRDEQPWPWRLNVAGRGFVAVAGGGGWTTKETHSSTSEMIIMSDVCFVCCSAIPHLLLCECDCVCECVYFMIYVCLM